MALRLLDRMCRLVQGEACAGLAGAIAEDVDRLAHTMIRHFVIWMNDWKRQAETGARRVMDSWRVPGEMKLH